MKFGGGVSSSMGACKGQAPINVQEQVRPRKPSLFAAYFLLGLVLAYFSPYLLGEEGAKRGMATLTAPFVAKFLYPSWNQAPPAQSAEPAHEGVPRPPITLALVTDDDLKAYGATYPLPYGFHADRLDSIASRNPSAIFLDLAFLDERPDASIDDFVHTLCDIGRGAPDRKPIPIFLASLDYLGQPLRKELKQAARQGCFKEVAVPRVTDQYDRHNWQYPLQVPASNASAEQAMDSPALAVYKAINPGQSWSSGGGFTDLALVWGMSPHAYNPLRMRDAQGQSLCRDRYEFWRDTPVLGALKTNWFGDASGLHGKPFCPFHASLPLHFLSSKTDVADTLLTGRVVIYAVDLQSLGDHAYSPLHGAIPGAYVHAMALDNLLRFNAGYPRAMDFDISSWTNAATVFPALMIGLVAMGVVASSCLKNKEFPIFEKFKKWNKVADAAKSPLAFLSHEMCRLGLGVANAVLRLLLTGVLLYLVGWVAFRVFHLGVFSWLEYAMLPMLLAAFHQGHGLANYLDRCYDTLWLGTNPDGSAHAHSNSNETNP